MCFFLCTLCAAFNAQVDISVNEVSNGNKAKTNSFIVDLNKVGKSTSNATALKLFSEIKLQIQVACSWTICSKSKDQWDTRAFLWTELPQSARLLSNHINVMDIQHSAFILHAVNMGADKQILLKGPPAQTAAQAL